MTSRSELPEPGVCTVATPSPPPMAPCGAERAWVRRGIPERWSSDRRPLAGMPAGRRRSKAPALPSPSLLKGGEGNFVRLGEAGFTLIEVVVVMAVLGFALVLLVGYRPPWSKGFDIDSTASELAGRLRLVRSEAIAGNRPVVL